MGRRAATATFNIYNLIWWYYTHFVFITSTRTSTHYTSEGWRNIYYTIRCLDSLLTLTHTKANIILWYVACWHLWLNDCVCGAASNERAYACGIYCFAVVCVCVSVRLRWKLMWCTVHTCHKNNKINWQANDIFTHCCKKKKNNVKTLIKEKNMNFYTHWLMNANGTFDMGPKRALTKLVFIMRYRCIS